MMRVGSRVKHEAKGRSFGYGTVLAINDDTVLVEWDTNEVTRQTANLARNQTHVHSQSLRPA